MNLAPKLQNSKSTQKDKKYRHRPNGNQTTTQTTQTANDHGRPSTTA